MARKQSIIEELENMGSLLFEHQPAQIYRVPDGYFENLPILMLFKVSADEEAGKIKLPETYQVKSGYFESFPQKMLSLVKESKEVSVDEELAGLSSLLSGIKRESPYTVKETYFDNLNIQPAAEKEKAKVISISSPRSWMRYAAAAIVIGFIAISGVWYFNQSTSIDPIEDPYAWVKQKTKKISNDDLESFIELANIESSAIDPKTLNPVKSAEMNELMEDVPDSEIIEFLNETPGSESNGDLILN